LKDTSNRRPLRAGFAAALSVAAILSLALLGGVGFAKSSITASQYQYGPKGKTTICHKGKTITVSNAALKGHKKHGDTVGACAKDKRKGKSDDKKADDRKSDDAKKGDDAAKSKAEAAKEQAEKAAEQAKAAAEKAKHEAEQAAEKSKGKSDDDHGKPDDKAKPGDNGNGKGKGK
jgi:hypothetical protein